MKPLKDALRDRRVPVMPGDECRKVPKAFIHCIYRMDRKPLATQPAMLKNAVQRGLKFPRLFTRRENEGFNQNCSLRVSCLDFAMARSQ